MAAASDEATSPFRPREVPPTRVRTTIADVISAWRAFGPLEHYATPFPTLNKLTGGGPIFGTRWYVMGAPDACKTLFLSMLAQVWDVKGLVVGMLAVDEEPEDLAMRFIQRISPESWKGGFFQRVHCETRDKEVLDLMVAETSHIGVVFYGPEWTIESAALDLANLGKEQNKRAAFLIDSVQTVECDSVRKEKREISLRERITENVKAIRNVATLYKMITVATSEMNRSAYRSIDKVEQNDMAAAKESGAIEYSARVMLAMRVVPEEEDCIEVRLIKNKHGPSYPRAASVFLGLVRAKQILYEREAPEIEDNLMKEVITLISDSKGGLSTEDIRKTLGKKKTAVVAALQSAESAKQIKRLNGERSPWVSVNGSSYLDPDSSEFP